MDAGTSYLGRAVIPRTVVGGQKGRSSDINGGLCSYICYSQLKSPVLENKEITKGEFTFGAVCSLIGSKLSPGGPRTIDMV